MAKKKLLIGLSVLVVLLAIAVVVLAVTYRGYVGESFVSDGENWSAEVNGGEMTLDLPSNPSTGFSWVVTHPVPHRGAEGRYRHHDHAVQTGLGRRPGGRHLRTDTHRQPSSQQIPADRHREVFQSRIDRSQYEKDPEHHCDAPDLFFFDHLFSRLPLQMRGLLPGEVASPSMVPSSEIHTVEVVSRPMMVVV